jgi:hypothetical protein
VLLPIHDSQHTPMRVGGGSGEWDRRRALASTRVNFTLPRHACGQFKYVADISDAGVSGREVRQGAEIYR